MDKELHKKILDVMFKRNDQVDEAKKPLHPNQQKIDVHEPEKDELTSKDFEMLRAGKKAKMKEEVEELDEAGMPSSVARHKQNIANMSDKEFAQKYSHLDDKGLKSMAWSHLGTKKGGPGTPGHSHYVNRMAKGKAELAKSTNEEVEELEELKSSTLKSYVDKAEKSYHSTSNPKTMAKRDVGLDRADRKLETKANSGNPFRKTMTKEEVDQIDELSKETMSSYLQKRGSMVSLRSKNNKGNENMARAVNKIAKKTNEEVEINDDSDETVLVHTPIEYELAENYMFGDYLTAAKSIVGEEKAIELANYAFNNSDTDIFVEQFLRSDIEAKVKAHENMGHKVSTPKYSTKSGKPHAEYVVTDKEGVRRKYIHHGANRKTENLGPVGKRDEE